MKFILIILFIQCAYASPPKRVISLSPALTELIYALNLQNSLIGVSDFSDYPEAAKIKPSVGPYSQPNIEKILKLKPDLVILPIEGPEDVKKHFDELHIPYHVVSMRTLSEVGSTAEEIGRLLGNSMAGKTFKEDWQSKLNQAFASSPQNKKNVFIEVQKDPLIAAGRETFLDEIVSRCGGINTTIEKGYPHLSLEMVVKRHFDLVFLADYFPNQKDKDETVAWWKKKSSATIIALNPDLTSRPGPRLLEGIHKICASLRAK